MSGLLFFFWLAPFGVNPEAILSQVLHGSWPAAALVLLTLTPANLVWFALLKRLIRQPGVRLGGYRAHDLNSAGY